MCNLNFIKLKDIVSFRSGKGIKCVGFDSTSTVKVYGANGVIGYTTNALINSPSIIVGRVGVNCGEVIYVNENCWVSDNAIICALDNENFDLMFIYYYLKCLNLNKLKGGSAQPLINQDILGNILVPIFSKHVQESIIALLSSFDKKISVNKQINKDLEELSQTLYTKWFVNFDFPNDEGKPYNSSGGEMVESEIGLIPKGWSVGVYSDFLNFERGIEVGSSNYIEKPTDSSIRFIRVKDMCSTNPSDYLYTDISCTKGKLCSSTDVLVSLDGSPGRTSIGVDGCYSTGIRKVSYNGNIANGEVFVYTTLKAQTFQAGVNNHAVGVNIKHAGAAINSVTVVVPPNELIEKFCTSYGNLYLMLVNNILENKSLSELRDTLLPYLMNGTITIK